MKKKLLTFVALATFSTCLTAQEQKADRADSNCVTQLVVDMDSYIHWMTGEEIRGLSLDGLTRDYLECIIGNKGQGHCNNYGYLIHPAHFDAVKQLIFQDPTGSMSLVCRKVD